MDFKKSGILNIKDLKKDTPQVSIKIQLIHPNAKVPTKATSGASGYDVYAIEECIIPPNKILSCLSEISGCYEKNSYALDAHSPTLVPLGFKVEIPPGYEIQIRPRSGLAFKFAITCVNSPGTIDSDYRGEVGVLLINHGANSYRMNVGDRIAQMVITKVPSSEFVVVEKAEETQRGEGGYGSTGK